MHQSCDEAFRSLTTVGYPSRIRMESTDAYFDRKLEELKLLNSCLAAPLSLDRPDSSPKSFVVNFS